MKYFTWHLYINLQSNSEEILEKAESIWDIKLKQYNEYLNQSQELPDLYNKLNLHDCNLRFIELISNQLIMGFDDYKLIFSNVSDFRIRTNKEKLYSYEFMGDWVIHELFRDKSGSLSLNVLLDSGIEINLNFESVTKYDQRV